MPLRRGFSMVELMLIIAIVGILASISLPMVDDMRLRAKRAELPGNVDGIMTAEVAYKVAHGRYLPIERFQPDAQPGPAPRAWEGADFDQLGWAPAGQVRGSYAAYPATGGQGEQLGVHGICDVDGNGDWSWWLATPTTPAHMVTVADEY